jgi:hypothetical protein
MEFRRLIRGDDHTMEDVFYEVVDSIREDVYKKLEDVLYESQLYNLGVYDITKEAVTEYLKNIMTDEKLKQKFVSGISKTLIQKQKEKNKKEKIQLAKNTKLWNITKGKIPCLNECGFTRTATKDEVLYESSNNFICGNCVKELEKDGNTSGTSKIFDTIDVYSIFNIK